MFSPACFQPSQQAACSQGKDCTLAIVHNPELATQRDTACTHIVVLHVVGHQVVQGEAIVCRHKVDGVAWLAVVARVQVAAARHARRKATLHACKASREADGK